MPGWQSSGTYRGPTRKPSGSVPGSGNSWMDCWARIFSASIFRRTATISWKPWTSPWNAGSSGTASRSIGTSSSHWSGRIQSAWRCRNRPPKTVLAQLGAETIFLGVGVDRIDYTKGILERFRGIECFLEKYLHYREQFTFVQFGAPSRTSIKRYQDFVAEVGAEADRINKRLQSERWRPIVLFSQHHSHSEFEPYYKAADFCLVTSLHDGMNLVAKEFVAAREDEDGVLILSLFTGASRELH